MATNKTFEQVIIDIEYWLRLATFLHEPLKNSLLHILHNVDNDTSYTGLPTDPFDLFKELQKFEKVIRKVKALKPIQFNILFPNNCTKVNSDKFDVTMIVVLLRNCTKLAPSSFWKIKCPPLNDLSKAAFVVRAREWRNYLHHNEPSSIDFNCFTNKWKEGEDIIKGLGYSYDTNGLKSIILDVNTSSKQQLIIQSLCTYCVRVNTHDIDIGLIKKRLTNHSSTLNYAVDTLKYVEDTLIVCYEELEVQNSKIDFNEERLQNQEVAVQSLEETQNVLDDNLKSHRSSLDSLEGSIEFHDKILVDHEFELGKLKKKQKKKKKKRGREHIVSDEEYTKKNKIDPAFKDIAVSGCLDIVCECIDKDWKKLAKRLSLSPATDNLDNNALKMKSCFGSNLVSWKLLKHSLKALDRNDIVIRIEKETCLTEAIENGASSHRSWIQSSYVDQAVTHPIMNTTGNLYRNKKRGEVYVELAAIEINSYLKSDNECDYHLRQMHEQPKIIAVEEIVKFDNMCVIIEGIAGIGKTELVDNLILKWTNGEIFNGIGNMPKIDFLLPIKCRQLNNLSFSETESNEDILKRLYPELFNGTSLSELLELGNKIMFIIDGVDELQSLQWINSISSIPSQRVSRMIQFFSDIIFGGIFTKQYTVVVGRPWAANYIKPLLEKTNKIVKRVQVCGFSEKSVEKYLEKHCDTNLKDIVHQKIAESKNLEAMSRVPVYLWVMCGLFENDSSIKTPQTVTELLLYACLVFIRNHFKVSVSLTELDLTQICGRKDLLEYITSLSKMSYLTLKEKNILFYESDYEGAVGLEKSGFVERRQDGEMGYVYQFTHLVLQELFCALHLFLSTELKPSIKLRSSGDYHYAITYLDDEGNDIVSSQSELDHLKFEQICHIESCFSLVAGIEGIFFSEDNSKTPILKRFLENLSKDNSQLTYGNSLIAKMHSMFVQHHRLVTEDGMSYQSRKLDRNANLNLCNLSGYLRCFHEYQGNLPEGVINIVTSKPGINLSIDFGFDFRFKINFLKKFKEPLNLSNLNIYCLKELSQDEIKYVAELCTSSQRISLVEPVEFTEYNVALFFENLYGLLKTKNHVLPSFQISWPLNESIDYCVACIPYIEKIELEASHGLNFANFLSHINTHLKKTPNGSKSYLKLVDCFEGESMKEMTVIIKSLEHFTVLEFYQSQFGYLKIEEVSILLKEIQQLAEKDKLKVKTLRLSDNLKFAKEALLPLIECTKYLNVMLNKKLLDDRTLDYFEENLVDKQDTTYYYNDSDHDIEFDF